MNCDTFINKNKKEWVEMKWEFMPGKAFLIEKGIDANCLISKGFGEKKHISQIDGDKNRRVEFLISEN